MYYLETSAKESDNVEKLFLDLACRLISEARQNTLVNNVSSPLPGEGKSISYLTCCNFNWRLMQGEAKGISSCPDGPWIAGQIWWWLWLPLLDPLTPVGSRAYTAWQAKGFVRRPALAEHTMVSPFRSQELEQGENCARRSMICRACCFCSFQKASKSAFLNTVQGEMYCRDPSCTSVGACGGCSLGLLGALVFLSTR